MRVKSFRQEHDAVTRFRHGVSDFASHLAGTLLDVIERATRGLRRFRHAGLKGCGLCL
jgi:hypothetical protein